MDRNSMIKKLSNVHFCAVATVATMDMGLQYDYISSDGAGTGFGDMAEWPVYKFSAIHQDKWAQIQAKLKDSKLCKADLDGTELALFYEDVSEIHTGNPYEAYEINKFFSGITGLPYHTAPFYCLFDNAMFQDDIEFFSSDDDVISAFKGKYCTVYRPWSEMEDYELKDWIDRLEDEFSEFPFLEYCE